MAKRKIDFIDKLIAYESGELKPKQERAFIKTVVKKGLATKLQGHYGRQAVRLGLLKGRKRR